MLKKLLKHEFNTVAKLLLLLHGMIVIFTIIECIVFHVLDLDLNTSPIGNIMLGIYFIFLLAISIATFIYLIVRFYKNLFTDEGYLTFTLPVKPYMLILSKLIVGFVWCLFDSILCIISAILVLSSNGILPQDIFIKFSTNFTSITLSENIPLSNIIMPVLLVFIMAIIGMLLTAYACICIGQLVIKHKILGAFLSYIVIYIFNQVISSIMFFALGIFDMLPATNGTNTHYELYSYFLAVFNLSNIQSIITCAIYFFICTYIISKKLNLD